MAVMALWMLWEKAGCHSGPPLLQGIAESPSPTVNFIPLESNIIYKTKKWKSKYLAQNTGSFILCEQTLPGQRAHPCLQ